MRLAVIPGDGIGPEVMAATERVLREAGARIDWIEAHAGLDFMPDLDSAEEPRVEGTTPALWTP